MPEIEIKDTKVQHLKVDMTLFNERIVEVKVGRVNVYVRLENAVAGKSVYPFKVDDMVEAGHWVPTADERLEKAKQDREFEREYLVNWIDKQTASVQGSIEKAIEAIKPDWVRYSEIDALLYVDAYTRIYGQFADYLERAREQKLHIAHLDGSEDCEYTEPTENGGMRCVKPTVTSTAYDGAERCVRWLADQLASRAANFRASSRSTSIMSNYMDDVYLEALGKVARDMRYAVGSELRDVLPKSW